MKISWSNQINPRVKRRDLILSIVTFLVSLFISLLFAELVIIKLKKPTPIIEVEPVGDYYQFNIKNGIEPKPDLKYKDYGIEASINKDGFYGPEIAKDKKGLRLAFMGDSYSIGPGIHFEENYPYLVHKKVKERFPNSDYIIGGLGGSSPFQQNIIFSNKIVRYNPDVVIYQLYDNDISDDFIFNYSQYYSRMKVFNSVPRFLMKSKLVKHMMIISMENLTKINRAYYESHKDLVADNPSLLWNRFSEPALDDMFNRTRRMGAKFILFYIPYGKEFDDEYEAGPSQKEPSVIHKNAKKWALKRRIPFIDMHDRFMEHNTSKLNELYLPSERGYHLTPFAANLVADEVYKLLYTRLPK